MKDKFTPNNTPSKSLYDQLLFCLQQIHDINTETPLKAGTSKEIEFSHKGNTYILFRVCVGFKTKKVDNLLIHACYKVKKQTEPSEKKYMTLLLEEDLIKLIQSLLMS